MTVTTLIAGLLIFAIGFALGFFVCVLGLVMTRSQMTKETKTEDPKNKPKGDRKP